MKKLLSIVLALAMVLSVGIFSFAAADTVSGTLADGTVISKLVSEVVKTGKDAEQYDDVKDFLALAAADPRTICTGVVDFGGFFDNITEGSVAVPLSVPDAKTGEKYLVKLSSGFASTKQCSENGVLTVDFPKDASELKTDNNWAPPAPPAGGEESSAGGISWPILEVWDDADGHHEKYIEEDGTTYESISKIEDGKETHTMKYSTTLSDGSKYEAEQQMVFVGEGEEQTIASWSSSSNTTREGETHHEDSTITFDGNKTTSVENVSDSWTEDGVKHTQESTTTTTSDNGKVTEVVYKQTDDGVENQEESYTETKTYYENGNMKKHSRVYEDGYYWNVYYDEDGNFQYYSPEWD